MKIKIYTNKGEYVTGCSSRAFLVARLMKSNSASENPHVSCAIFSIENHDAKTEEEQKLLIENNIKLLWGAIRNATQSLSEMLKTNNTAVLRAIEQSFMEEENKYEN